MYCITLLLYIFIFFITCVLFVDAFLINKKLCELYVITRTKTRFCEGGKIKLRCHWLTDTEVFILFKIIISKM